MRVVRWMCLAVAIILAGVVFLGLWLGRPHTPRPMFNHWVCDTDRGCRWKEDTFGPDREGIRLYVDLATNLIILCDTRDPGLVSWSDNLQSEHADLLVGTRHAVSVSPGPDRLLVCRAGRIQVAITIGPGCAACILSLLDSTGDTSALLRTLLNCCSSSEQQSLELAIGD